LAVTCSDIFGCCTSVRIRGTVKGSTTAVVSEASAVKTLTAAENTYTGIQIVTTSMKCVPPQAIMKRPKARNIQ
jgi:hypothetical protein